MDFLDLQNSNEEEIGSGAPNTALILAARCGYDNIVKTLFRLGGDKNLNLQNCVSDECIDGSLT